MCFYVVLDVDGAEIEKTSPEAMRIADRGDLANYGETPFFH